MNRQARKTRWRDVIRGNVLMMGLVSFFTDASSEMIYPLLPLFFAGLVPVGAVAVYIGLMEGVAESTASLLKIFSGRLSDTLGKRKLLAVVGYGLSTLSRPAMALATGGWHVILMRFADRVGKGIRTAPRDALISDSAGPEVRGFAFSFHRGMDHAGAVLGPVVAVVGLYVFLGHGLWRGSTEAPSPGEMTALRWLFVAALIPGLAAMATLVFKVREIGPVGDAKEESAADEQPIQSKSFGRRFYFFLLILIIFTLGNSSDLFLVLYGKTMFGLGPFGVVGLWVALHVSKIVFSLPGGMLSDRFGRRVAIVAGWSVYVLVYVGMAGVSELWVFGLLIALYGVYYGMTEGAERAMVADYVPSDRRGRAYGLYHGAVGLATLPASLLFGIVWVKFGPQVSFAIGASLAGVATLLLLVLLSGSARAGTDKR